MTLAELAQKRSKLLHDAQQIMLGENVTAEQRTQATTMLADADLLTADMALLTRASVVDQEERSQNIIPRSQPAGNNADTRTLEQRRADTQAAYRNYLRTGQVETRDLGVTADGIFIPTGVAEPSVARVYAGSILDLVYRMPSDTGEPIKVPYLNDTAQSFVLNSAGITVTDPTVGGITISIDDLRSNPILVETSLVQDASYDIAGFINQAINSRYQRTVSNWITLGNASNVGGLSTITAGITGGTTLVLSYNDLVGLLTTLDPAYTPGAAWVMNNATLGLLLKVVDSNNRPIFLPYSDGGNSGFVGTCLGYPVKINPYQPSIGVGNKFIQFGNFKEGYTFREVNPGIQILRLAERYAELKKVGFVAFARVGGAVTDAGTHPIVTLTGK
jgi:HK97 family phage major capsid protein